MPPRAVIFGCAGTALSEAERGFFAATDPLGFILFARNCRDRPQVRALVVALRGAVGRDDAPVLIDQEGGRVARLRPPEWRAAPAPAAFGALDRAAPEAAIEAVRLNAKLIAADLADLGITVNCAPVLDVASPGMHEAIGDRAYADGADVVARLGRACAEGLLEGGVLPALKHLPGHGRAGADTHLGTTAIEATRKELRAVDFAPFRALAEMPIGIVGHPIYTALDARNPASVSPVVIAEAIRAEIGFDGLLISDDLNMAALSGSPGARAAAALAAGCDIALHCNGEMVEMVTVAESVGAMSPSARERWGRTRDRLVPAPGIDRRCAEAALAARLGLVTGSQTVAAAT